MTDSINERRNFLKFLGVSSVGLSILSTLNHKLYANPVIKIYSIPPSTSDRLELAPGLEYEILIKWDEEISDELEFGYNNDYLAFIPIKAKTDEALLWINHESPTTLFVSGRSIDSSPTRSQIDKERKSVGASILYMTRTNGSWRPVKNHPLNRRLDATTPIAINSPAPIAGSFQAIGTLGNCGGGVTPWGTVLSCEENYQDYYGDIVFKSRYSRKSKFPKHYLQWNKFYDLPPEHYGWVVEVNPQTGKAQKLTALGRFAHESATAVQAKDGRCVVYSGDDKTNECLYKFISAHPNSLEQGTLYVADVKNGIWIPLDIKLKSELAEKFDSQLELLIYTRKASRVVGGSRLDRPEDIVINPHDGSVLVALTKNLKNLNFYGSLLRIEEQDADPLSLSFEATTFIAGGRQSGFANPDNMAFDKSGNLWMTSDISEKVVDKGPYKGLGNNGLFYIPMYGSNAGKAYRVASAPVDAEFTGPCFSTDGSTLFLSVQHPGGSSESLQYLTSHWPDGDNSIPKPAVVTIRGKYLTDLTGYRG